MAPLSKEELAAYLHSPVHLAIARGDHGMLRRILTKLPNLPKAGEVCTEAESIKAEKLADELSAVIDRRDVPGRETPLNLAVRLGDAVAVDMLMAKGADWSLQNERGWSALQEAVCSRQEGIAMIITRYYQPLAWAKWCRRLPRLVAGMNRMRDFYMELTFHFESSVIPFIGRIAPSDTYRIWKRGPNLRADMTLAGFDGFRIQRCDQSFLFLAEGSDDGRLPPGSLCLVNHKDREVMNTLEGAGAQLSEAEVAQEVATMSQTNIYRPGIDVTQAELVCNLNWRRQEKTEMVGPWKAKVYDMHHVTISVRSRKVPGAITDDELFDHRSRHEDYNTYNEDYSEGLTDEEKWQLENALQVNTEFDEDLAVEGQTLRGRTGSFDNLTDAHFLDNGNCFSEVETNDFSNKENKKGWFSLSRKSMRREPTKKIVPSRNSLNIEDMRRENGHPTVSGFDASRNGQRDLDGQVSFGRRHSDFKAEEMILRKGKERGNRKNSKDLPHKHRHDEDNESEYKKSLRPVLWLTKDFPLKCEELLPLLDILADKVKAVRRLRELLTTKLPAGTFPVKMAIPVVPTIRVMVTFTKFEELSPLEIFSTPLSSPRQFEDVGFRESEHSKHNSGSWLSWIKGPQAGASSSYSEEDTKEEDDPFLIPSDYVWVDLNEKKRRTRKGKGKKGKKTSSQSGPVDAELDDLT